MKNKKQKSKSGEIARPCSFQGSEGTMCLPLIEKASGRTHPYRGRTPPSAGLIPFPFFSFPQCHDAHRLLGLPGHLRLARTSPPPPLRPPLPPWKEARPSSQRAGRSIICHYCFIAPLRCHCCDPSSRRRLGNRCRLGRSFWSTGNI